MKRQTVVILSQCGAGKTTLVDSMEEYGFRQVDCYTTRPRREYDPGRICVTPEKFNEIRPKLVAHTIINGFEYGTTQELLDEGHMYILDYMGLEVFKKNIPRDQMCIVYIDASEWVRGERIAKDRSAEEALARLHHDRKAWADVKIDADLVLRNETPDDLNRNIEVLRALLTHLYGEQ